MIGILLVLFAGFFEEAADSIGKDAVGKREESVYTMGFLNLLWPALIFFFVAFYIRGTFIFSLQSLPTFLLRLVLEILQVHVTLKALVYADRSTYGFLRTLTIPLLLIADLTLGYEISPWASIGASLIALALVVLLVDHDFSKKGSGFVLISAVNAVATISLYKYNISHFNSVEAEQAILYSVLLVYLFIFAVFRARENPFRFLIRPKFIAESFSMGIASVLLSFAYLFGAASLVTAMKRGVAVLYSILFGKIYFREKHVVIKTLAFLGVLAGLILIVF